MRKRFNEYEEKVQWTNESKLLHSLNLSKKAQWMYEQMSKKLAEEMSAAAKWEDE